MATVINTVKKYFDGSIDAVTTFKRNVNSDNARRILDGRAEACIIGLACGSIPEGYSRWTIRLLEEKSRIVLDIPVSREAIRRALKNKLRPHCNSYWCILTKDDAEFIACMKVVLDVYGLSYNPERPVVCRDENRTNCWKMQGSHCLCVLVMNRKQILNTSGMAHAVS